MIPRNRKHVGMGTVMSQEEEPPKKHLDFCTNTHGFGNASLLLRHTLRFEKKSTNC